MCRMPSERGLMINLIRGDVPEAASQWWSALELLARVLEHAGRIYRVEKEVYATARDKEPFRVSLRLMSGTRRVDELEYKLFQLQTALAPLVGRLEAQGGRFVWEDEERFFVTQLGECLRVWRMWAAGGIRRDEIEGIFGGRFVTAPKRRSSPSAEDGPRGERRRGNDDGDDADSSGAAPTTAISRPPRAVGSVSTKRKR